MTKNGSYYPQADKFKLNSLNSFFWSEMKLLFFLNLMIFNNCILRSILEFTVEHTGNNKSQIIVSLI